MKIRKIRKLLTAAAAAITLYAACASAGAEGAPKCTAMGGVLSSGLETTVTLTCEGENALGAAAVLRAEAGSGTTAKIAGNSFSCGWAFDYVRESVRVTLYDERGSYLFEPAYAVGEEGTLILMCPDLADARVVVITDGESGLAEVSFDMDMSGMDRCDVTCAMRLRCDAIPAFGPEQLISGMWPLGSARWISDGNETAFTVSETGYMVLPYTVTAEADGTYYTHAAGDVVFTVTDGNGAATEKECDEWGEAVFELDSGRPFEGAERVFTVSEASRSDFITVQAQPFTVTGRDGLLERNGDGYEGVRTYTVTDAAGEKVLETAQTVQYFWDGAGNLGARVTGDTPRITFRDEYLASGECEVAGRVSIPARYTPARADEFTLILKENGEEIARTTTAAGGRFSFDPIVYDFTDIGVKHYTVVEEKGESGGVIYDENEYEVSVTVTDVGDGVLLAVPDGDVVIVNGYESRGTLELPVTTVFRGRELKAGELTYGLYLGQSLAASAPADAGGNAVLTMDYTLDDIRQGKGGAQRTNYITYTVRLVTEDSALPGIKADRGGITVRVRLQDKNNGNIECTFEPDASSIMFAHSYSAQGTVDITGTVSFTEGELSAGQFSFVVREGEKTLATASNGADGSIVFPPIRFDQNQTGSHTLTVSQYTAETASVQLDTRTFTLDVTVKDVGDGTLKTSWIVTDSPDGRVTFENGYHANGSFTPSATMSLAGRAVGEKEFCFRLLSGPDVLQEAWADTAGRVTFEPIRYTLADVGRHEYTVRAVMTPGAYVTCRAAEIAVTVDVSDTGTGALDVRTAGKAPVFEFYYEASGRYVAQAGVTLEGREIASGELLFNLVENSVVVSSAAADANGDIRFDPVEYTAKDAGTHVYSCVQSQTVPGGVVRDATSHTVTVTVTDLGNGRLRVESEGDDALEFFCTYAASGSYKPQARVFLNNGVLAEGRFTFEILENDRVVRTRQNRADGLIDFSEIVYSMDDVGRHEYSVRQTGLELNGISLDKNTYKLVVVVSDNGDGTLKAERLSGDIRFNNEYKTVGTAYLNGKVVLSGRAMKEGEFTFDVKCGDRLITTGVNGEGGAILFQDMVFTEKDLVTMGSELISDNSLTLEVSMRPVAPDAGLTGDGTVFSFRVGLKDLGNGTMSVTKSPEADGILFRVSYSAAGEAVISGKAETADYSPAEGDFTFRLWENGKEIARAENLADGSFAFPPVKYTHRDAGVHTYTVTQDAGSLPGMVYDGAAREVTVTVTDDGLGGMTAAFSGDETVFSNRQARSGEMTLSAAVDLAGRELKEGEITFVLTEDGQKKAEAVNDAEGKVSFTVVFAEPDAGEHVYEIGPAALPEGVSVKSGGLTRTVRTASDGAGRISWWTVSECAAPFEAVYSAYAKAEITARAALSGRAMEEGLFTYVMKGPDGYESEKACSADGLIVFGPIEFTEADVGEKRYTVTRAAGSMAGYTLDGKTSVVTVTVADNGDGTLKVSQSHVPVFENSYLAEGTADIGVRAEVTGRQTAAGEFVFALEENGTEIARAASDGTGRAMLAQMEYTQVDAGEHVYTVKRVSPLAPALTPGNGETAQIRVTVFDNGDGTLSVSVPEEMVFTYAYHASGAFTLSVRAEMTGRGVRKGEFEYALEENGAEIARAAVDETGLAVFPEIRYAEGDAGERHYRVTLCGALPGGVSGDGSAEAAVKLTDDLKGGIAAECGSAMPLAMKYVYAPKGTAEIVCRVTTERVTAEEGDFALVLLDVNGKQVTAVNESDGTVVFPPITYALEDVGEHIYWVRQEKGDKQGVVYDELVRQVKVTVKEENDGTLSCRVSGEPVFANGYAAAGSFTPEARLDCVGFTPAAKEIRLIMTRDGSTVAEGVNDSEGKVVFSPIAFTDADAGEHSYLVYALSDVYTGMTAPEEGVPVRVAVKDMNDGTLEFTADGETVVPLSYLSAGHARVELSVKLNGREMKDGEFAFALVENNSVIGTTRSDKNGAAGFDVFYETGDAGEHTYQVMQLDNGLKAVTIQDSRFTVKVKVADLGTGELETEVTYPEGGIVFENTYASTGTLKVTGQVILTGKDLREGEFALALYRDGKQVLSALCDGRGNVAFDGLALTPADVGILELSLGQIPSNESGIVFDETVYPLVVTVTDDGEGVITGEYATPPAFRNRYEAKGEAAITSEVNLVGRMLSENSFTLTLSENGEILRTKTNDAEGVVRFDPIVYGLDDVGTHIYEISETGTTEAGVPLSSEKQIVTVNVSDAGGGVLKTVISGNGYVFRNSFTATASLSIRARLKETGVRTGESPRMILSDAEGNTVEEITAVDGVNVFTPIAFSQADAGKRFVYTVSCTGVESVYTVEANVSDGRDGTLTVSETIRGSEGVTDGIRFAIEYAMELKITVSGTRESVPCTVTLTADGVALKGVYPVSGAQESTVTSGGKLTLKPDSTAVISSLPADTHYAVTFGMTNRYDVKAQNTEGALTGGSDCRFDCTFRTTDFRVRAEMTDENGVTANVPASLAAWKLYANGTEVRGQFEADGNEFVVSGLTYADTSGRVIEYAARVDAGSDYSVTYINAGDYADNTDEVYSGGTVQLRKGQMFSVRIRFTQGGDEPVYTYRTVSAVLYSEEGRVGDVSLTPDESGWCRLAGLDANHEYHVVLSGVSGYVASNRNVGRYGNVTRYLYDGGTATFTVGKKGPSTKRLAAYGAAGVAGIGAIGGAVYLFVKNKRKKKAQGAKTD